MASCLNPNSGLTPRWC